MNELIFILNLLSILICGGITIFNYKIISQHPLVRPHFDKEIREFTERKCEILTKDDQYYINKQKKDYEREYYKAMDIISQEKI